MSKYKNEILEAWIDKGKAEISFMSIKNRQETAWISQQIVKMKKGIALGGEKQLRRNHQVFLVNKLTHSSGQEAGLGLPLATRAKHI